MVLAKQRLARRGRHGHRKGKGKHGRLARLAHGGKHGKHKHRKHTQKLPGIPDPNSRVYCGKGKFGACRAALIASLRGAIDADPYPPSQKTCSLPSKQMCFDAIEFRPTGAVTQPDMVWMNRPTFQQADQIQGHR